MAEQIHGDFSKPLKRITVDDNNMATVMFDVPSSENFTGFVVVQRHNPDEYAQIMEIKQKMDGGEDIGSVEFTVVRGVVEGSPVRNIKGIVRQ